MKNTKQLFNKYWHILFVLYLPVYMVCFLLLEGRETTYMNVHIPLDDMIPFNKYFIVPYLLWFAYIAVTLIFFFFYSRREFIKYATFLIVGMSICLVIYLIFPTGQSMRPVDLTGNDILTKLVQNLYTVDTSTNICPSIHVLNSVIAHIAIAKSTYFKNKKILKSLSFILMVSICLSTVFLKQHSALDGICSLILTTLLYIPIYGKRNIFDKYIAE